jgi:phosphoribosylformylglycinamidine synthase
MADYGLLPGFDGYYEDQSTSLAPNDSGIFEDRWVHLKASPDTRCIFTKDIGTIQLPIRHGEGKFTAMNRETLVRLSKDKQIALRYVDPATGSPTQDYPLNPNGSVDAIAGICDPTGRVFGLMPHPEAYSSPYNHPNWIRQRLHGELPKEGLGLQLFRNAVEYIQQHF